MEDFVVSARKYRPATFVSVVGQNHITSTLKNAISRNQLAHAYLFCGPRGVGKTTCARIFAKAINCLSPLDTEACNECESCRSFNEGRSFSIHELDAASNNSVDDIRSLTDQVRIPPQIGKYSVYIIDEVHMLSAQAFNAFLKTLEEPPAHAIFILATTEKHKIIPTILSRCQIFDFNRIKVEDSVSYLTYIAGQEGVTFDDESLNLIAQKADGGMRDALSMFDKAVSFCGSNLNFKQVAQAMNVLDYDTYFQVTKLLLDGEYPQALTLYDEILQKGFSGQTFITGLNTHFRDMLMCKNPQTLPLLEVTGSLGERYRVQSEQCDVGFLFSSIALLTEIDGTLRTASNQRLNIELGLMKLCGLGKKKNDHFPTVELPPLNGVTNRVEPVQQTPAPPKPEPTPTPKPTAEPTAEPKKTVSLMGGISGKSLSSILENRPASEVEKPVEHDQTVAIDPESQQKISAVAVDFHAMINTTRPRIAMAFRDMVVAGNVVSVNVPSHSLMEEIVRGKTELLVQLVELSQVSGIIELVVCVEETVTGLKPIKVEDKLKFLVEKNPFLTKLRKELDLDLE